MAADGPSPGLRAARGACLLVAVASTALAGCGDGTTAKPRAATTSTVASRHVAAPAPRRDGLVEAYPDLSQAIRPADPVATARALERLRFEAHWVLIRRNPSYRHRRLTPGAPLRPEDQPTVAKQLPRPLPHTRILSVLNQRGGIDAIPGSRKLMIEITPKGPAGFQD
jgi:hypothetical protein